MTKRLRGTISIDLTLEESARLFRPGELSVFFLKEDSMRNGYQLSSTFDSHATKRTLTVDEGNGSPVMFTFDVAETITFAVNQDTHVKLTLIDSSTDPLWLDSPPREFEFDATERNPPVAKPLAQPGEITVAFTGETE